MLFASPASERGGERSELPVDIEGQTQGGLLEPRALKADRDPLAQHGVNLTLERVNGAAQP